MYRGYFTLLTVIVLLLSSQSSYATSDYVGSEKCSECHAENYASWSATGHHLMLRKSEQAEHAGLTLPLSYSWDDITYVIGGVRQKALYLDRDGFIITKSKDGKNINTFYNLEENAWQGYVNAPKVAYECGPCHTTGYKPDGHQDGLPGIVGTWAEDGIGCETCHGPGRSHISHPQKRGLTKEPTAEVCEECHQRGGISTKPLSDLGLALHHEQLNELKAGAHKGLTCINCHNPHKRATEAKQNCTVCHSRIYSKLIQDPHGKSGVKCVDCHMPKIGKPAISRVSYTGDMRTHLFKINLEPTSEPFKIVVDKDKKSLFFSGYITAAAACLGCHRSHDKAWAVKHATNFHE